MQCFSDRIIAVSGAIAEQFSDRRKVLVINNGFELAECVFDGTG